MGDKKGRTDVAHCEHGAVEEEEDACYEEEAACFFSRGSVSGVFGGLF